MVFYSQKARQPVCIARLLWSWCLYALAMVWIWNGLSLAGFPPPAIWTLAWIAGAMVVLATREI